MARTPHTPRRSKRLRNRPRPIHSIATVQRQSLRVAIRQSLEQHQPVSAGADSSCSSIDSRDSSPVEASSPNEDSSITDANSQKSLGHFNGIPDKKPGWFKIKRIVAQRLNYYLVEWDGVDPDTGLGWPLDFVYRTDVSSAALRAWHAVQNAGGLRRARCGTLIMEESQDLVDYEEAWQRSIRQACGKPCVFWPQDHRTKHQQQQLLVIYHIDNKQSQRPKRPSHQRWHPHNLTKIDQARTHTPTKNHLHQVIKMDYMGSTKKGGHSKGSTFSSGKGGHTGGGGHHYNSNAASSGNSSKSSGNKTNRTNGTNGTSGHTSGHGQANGNSGKK